MMVYEPPGGWTTGSITVNPKGGVFKNQRVTKRWLPTKPITTAKEYVETAKSTANWKRNSSAVYHSGKR